MNIMIGDSIDKFKVQGLILFTCSIRTLVFLEGLSMAILVISKEQSN